MLKTHGRFDCSPFNLRPKFTWPDGRRLAVYLALNIEHFPYGEPVGVDLDRQVRRVAAVRAPFIDGAQHVGETLGIAHIFVEAVGGLTLHPREVGSGGEHFAFG